MNTKPNNNSMPSPAAPRRGSVYLAVMGVATIVSIIGMLSMRVARLQLKSTTNAHDLQEARLLAQAGVEFGLANMQTYSDWRGQITNGAELTSLTVGNGTMTYSLYDDDGDLDDDATDTVRLRGIGRVGDAVCVISTQLEPAGAGLTSLESSLHSNGNVVQDAACHIHTDQTVSTNSNLSKSTGNPNIDGDAWAVGNINVTVQGTSSPGQSPPKEMPNSSSVFDYYIDNGTPIAYSDMGGSIDKQLIGPNHNPFGASTNAQGIYVIDCGGNDVTIKESRIYGTLVLLNAGSGSNIDGSIHWSPVVANFPALMVQGNIELKWQGLVNLSESSHSVNFNPTDAPYQGVEDSDTSDVYPPLIKGIVYVSGNLLFSDECFMEGSVVVGGTTTVNEVLTLTYDATHLTNPPPGFSGGSEMQIVPGTWRREAY